MNGLKTIKRAGDMDFSKFTDRARKAMATLIEMRANQRFIGTEHILLALLNDTESYASEIFGVTEDKVLLKMTEMERETMEKLHKEAAEKERGAGI